MESKETEAKKNINEVHNHLSIYKSEAKKLVDMLNDLKPEAEKRVNIKDIRVTASLKKHIVSFVFDSPQQAKDYFSKI